MTHLKLRFTIFVVNNYINPTFIDLILTNRSTYFQNTRTIETGLSDLHKMAVTVMKTNFKK